MIKQRHGDVVPELRFFCPTTQTFFDSGMRLDEKTAKAARLKIARVVCPECHREHRVLVADGLLGSDDFVSENNGFLKSA